MIYRVPLRLNKNSTPWAKDIAAQLSLRPVEFKDYYPFNKIVYKLKTTFSALYKIIQSSKRIHALHFDGDVLLIHPDGLSTEVRKLAAHAVLKAISKNLTAPQ